MVERAALKHWLLWVLVGVVVVTLVVLLLGFRGGSGEVVEAGGAKVLIAGSQSGGSDVRGGGTLEVVGGCLGAGGKVYVFPDGTEVVDEDPLTVDIPGSGAVSLGEDFEVGGGWEVEHSSADVESGAIEVGGVTVPAECAKYDIFLSAPE